MMAKNTAKPKMTKPAVIDGEARKDKSDQSLYQQNLFLVMAFNMTWQLAIVVLVPLLGGYKLDQHFGSSPLYALIGLMLAIVGVAAVLMRILAEAKDRTDYNKGDKK